MTVPGLLAASASRSPDGHAIRIGDEITSHGELDRLAARAAAGLADRGVRPGDRVAVWLPNCVEWLAVFLALCRLRATLVAVNTRYRSAEIEHVLRRSRAATLVMSPSFRQIDFPGILAGVAPDAVPDLRSVVLVGGATPDVLLDRPTVPWTALLDSGEGPADASDAHAPCILFATSGTTRGPKLVVHTQRSVTAHARAIVRAFELDAPDAGLLGMLPFCGVFGFVGAIAALAAPARLVGMPVFDPQAAVDLVRQHRITHTFGTDEMLERMLAVSAPDAALSSLKLFGYAAFQPGGMEVARRASRRGVPVIGLYGSSEAQALFAAQPVDGPADERIEPGGFPIHPQAAARICDPETGEALAPGASGELQVRGPSLFAEYLDDAEATGRALTEDGFFRTGDLARLRPNGSFVFEARVGDVLRLGGFLVAPADIEAVVEEAPGIEKAQVVGVVLEGGLAPVAFVTVHAGTRVDPDAVVAHCRERMARFKVPRRVWILEAFPVTVSSNGTKIQKARLRDMAEERLEREDGR